MSVNVEDPLFDLPPGLNTHILHLGIAVAPHDDQTQCPAISVLATLTGAPDLGITRELVYMEGLASVQHGEGEDVIFTCGCGYPECAGYGPVHVAADGETVVWTWKHGPFERKAVLLRDHTEQVITDALNLVQVLRDAVMEEYGRVS